jgi:flagellar basal-body rod modification protein FlgD
MSTVDKTNSVLDSLTKTNAARQPSNSLGQDQFLQLMVAQLKNQDPMQPMQNGEFLSQMAQFGTVKGVQELQNSFSQLAGSLQSNQALMASSMVGRSVLVPGQVGSLEPGAGLAGAVAVPSSSNVVVGIYNTSGQMVRHLDYGTQPAGQMNFVWDGVTDSGAAAPAGNYQIRAVTASGAETKAADTLVRARVDSVSLGGTKGMQLNLAGLGTVAFNDVKQIY